MTGGRNYEVLAFPTGKNAHKFLFLNINVFNWYNKQAYQAGRLETNKNSLGRLHAPWI